MSITPDEPHTPTPEHTRTSQASEAADQRLDVEAVDDERSGLATHEDPTLAAGSERSQVEWVRAGDLAALGGAKVLGRGQDLNNQLKDAVTQAVREPREVLRQRLDERASDVSVSTPERSQSPAAGREGVGR